MVRLKRDRPEKVGIAWRNNDGQRMIKYFGPIVISKNKNRVKLALERTKIRTKPAQ